jgi:hypothetical protein
MALRVSIVGLSSAEADGNSDAPTLSPAESSRVWSAPAASRSRSTVVAHLVVLASMRPWKSFIPSKLSATVPSAGGASKPTSSGSWSEERNAFGWKKSVGL